MSARKPRAPSRSPISRSCPWIRLGTKALATAETTLSCSGICWAARAAGVGDGLGKELAGHRAARGVAGVREFGERASVQAALGEEAAQQREAVVAGAQGQRGADDAGQLQ